MIPTGNKLFSTSTMILFRLTDSVNKVLRHYLNQLVSDGQASNTLDLNFLSNLDLLIKNVIPTPIGNNEHMVIILEFCLPTKQPSSKQQKYTNYELISKRGANVSWKQLITYDINISSSNVKTEILHTDKTCTRIFCAKQAKSIPFLTTELIG